MYLYTIKEINSDEWIELSIDDNVMKKAEEILKRKENPLLTKIPCLNGHQGYPSWTAL